MAGIPSPTEPLAAVRSLAEAAANQRGTTLVGSDLRLFEGVRSVKAVDRANADAVISPFDLGRAYELLLAPTARRAKGAHLTPEKVARRLVAMMPIAKADDRVLDPSVGGAAFLLAAVDELVAAGCAPSKALEQLHGVDIDAGAVVVAEAALGIWAIDSDCAVAALPSIWHGDGLLDDLPEVERVVGNPPFLNQLRSSSSHSSARRAELRERWGNLVEAYTDDAWLFLASGFDTLAPGGALALVQPVSILAARHGHAVREFIHEHGKLTGLWIARDRVFDAAVQVCGVIAQRSHERINTPVERAVGAGFDTVAALPSQPTADTWGHAAATAIGIPDVRLQPKETLGGMASATAGFRDQFYGFVPYVTELDPAEPVGRNSRLVTVGMIDPLGLSWGTRPFKFAKRDVKRPIVDLDALRLGDPSLGQWCDARLQPKLLMATQTRVVEVWPDEDGTALPATPVLSIEPHDNDPDVLWMLAAALSSPAMSAYFLASKLGTAMALNSMKLAARDVIAAPLPVNNEPWSAAAALIRSDGPDLAHFAQLMGEAYEQRDAGLQAWWLERVGWES